MFCARGESLTLGLTIPVRGTRLSHYMPSRQSVGRGVAVPILDAGAKRGDWTEPHPCRLARRKKSNDPSYRSLVGNRKQCGKLRIFSLLLGFETQSAQHFLSLYRLRYFDLSSRERNRKNFWNEKETRTRKTSWDNGRKTSGCLQRRIKNTKGEEQKRKIPFPFL